MKRYKDWAPGPFDTKGLNLPDHQEWFVLPLIKTRDSGPLDESNFEIAARRLGAPSDTCIRGEFSHWACGWFEILLLAPEREQEGQAIADELDSYPILDESDFSKRESELEFECWPNYGCAEMIRMMAEKFDLRQSTIDFLESLDQSSNGPLRELHSAHSSHDYEMDDSGARYDFLYLDTRYLHFPENQRFDRQTLAKFIRAEREKFRETEADVRAVERAATVYARQT